MSNLRRVLETQQKEREEIRRRRAEEDRDADEEEEQMLAATVCMLNQSKQHRRRRVPNVDRRRDGKFVHEGVPSQTYAEGPAKASTKRRGSRFPRNDWKHRLHALAVEELSYCLARRVTYQINNIVYSCAYYLADGIYPRWTTFVKTILNPQSEKERSFASFQEGYRKDVERCFGILQARWAIIRGAARMLDDEVLRSIMMTCIILHNMIVEDEYDYDAPKVFEPDPMNTALTRIYG
ncbi:unnamed protein product [Prunus brigantina]